VPNEKGGGQNSQSCRATHARVPSPGTLTEAT
jgi:hypothetical protein